MIYNKTNFRIHSLAEKESRYYLNGLHVTPNYTEVTNGHYLIRVDAPFSGKRKEVLKDLPTPNNYKPVTKESKFILPADTARELEKNIPNERSITILNNAWLVEDKEDEATFITTDMQTTKPVTFRKVDQRFPNTDSILEKIPKDAPITIGFNPDYMIKICQQYKKAGIQGVALSLYGTETAMKIQGKDVHNEQTITSLLMPMKVAIADSAWNVEEKK